jgi:hypothetical protein
MKEKCYKTEEVMNYSNYFEAGNGEMDFGQHGPEIEDDVLFISIYHFLEFLGLNPKNYHTLNLGKYLTQISSKYLTCKYKAQSFDINKFDIDMLCDEMENFEKYKR